MSSVASIDLAAVIQLSVAPVFLLVGIAGFLNVMSIRLARIVDRSRFIDKRLLKSDNDEETAISQQERLILIRRASLTNHAIVLCTSSAVSACILVICLFIAEIFSFSISHFIVALFVLTMSCLIASLSYFLKEIHLAIHNLRVAREFTIDGY